MIEALVILAIFVLIYMSPTIIALINEKQNTPAIAVLNILLGWTLIGWVGALVWAMCKDKK